MSAAFTEMVSFAAFLLKSGWALYQHSPQAELHNISTLTSSCAAYCFLFPLLIQMTWIWTISVEHPDWRQSIYCAEGSLSGCGMRNNMHGITLHAAFVVRLARRCYFYVAIALFVNLSAQVGVCACDQPVVKSHFSGILHFIIQMTSSKIRSPQ